MHKVEPPPPRRRLPLDNRVGSQGVRGGARIYYDSLDIGENRHALAVTVLRPELSQHTWMNRAALEHVQQDVFFFYVVGDMVVNVHYTYLVVIQL